jgi:hypothetical protein
MTSPTAVTVTVHQLCDAIETTLGSAAGIQVHQTFDELTEGVNDRAVLQVYPESCRMDAIARATTHNDRTASLRGVAVAEFVFNADIYAQQRTSIGEDMAALVPLIDAIVARLEAQKKTPLFGLTVSGIAPIKSFKWDWRRVVFEYAQAQYMGVRFTITIWIF